MLKKALRRGQGHAQLSSLATTAKKVLFPLHSRSSLCFGAKREMPRASLRSLALLPLANALSLSLSASYPPLGVRSLSLTLYWSARRSSFRSMLAGDGPTIWTTKKSWNCEARVEVLP